MFLRKHFSLDDRILAHLQHGSMIILDLIATIKRERPGTTKQGVYAALRILKKEEVVVLHAGRASLNAAWLTNVHRYFTIAEHYYFQKNVGAGHFANLREGEKIQYTFTSPLVADTFWIHALFILIETTPPGAHFIAYDPHCWFFLAHAESERGFVRFARVHKRLYLVSVGARTPLDRLVAREVDGTHSQYAMLTPAPFPSTRYINIIGDYVIDVSLEKRVADAMDAFYTRTREWTPDVGRALRHLVEERGRTKLVISRNAKKAEQLRRKFLKSFYIPKEINVN
ncbi:MAG: hypothetical protein HYV34_02580 [Candidatus Kerfeldbacteria bacterium]|nr:hypothetical protein [Candidatus Kerfeldbacteria bacterium]